MKTTPVQQAKDAYERGLAYMASLGDTFLRPWPTNADPAKLRNYARAMARVMARYDDEYSSSIALVLNRYADGRI